MLHQNERLPGMTLGLVYAKKGDQRKSVAALLMGFRLSGTNSLEYLDSLKADENPAISAAATAARKELEY